MRLYSEALSADPQNCILYSNRSAAYLRLGQYATALDDAIKARVINPKWPKVSTCEGNVAGEMIKCSVHFWDGRMDSLFDFVQGVLLVCRGVVAADL